MKHLLTFLVEERAVENSSPEEMKEAMELWTAFEDEAAQAGALIACEPVESGSTKTLHLHGAGESVVSDGPFAESKEQLGGFALLECASFEEALEWAHKVPMSAGAIEVRPVMDLSQFGYESRTLRPARASA